MPVQEANNNLFLITCTNREQIFVYMKEIKLGKKDVFALVDDEDFDYLMQWKWYLGSGRYPTTRTLKRMHNLLIISDKNRIVDHINGNQLDNRRGNLRLCTSSQNSINHFKQKGSYTSIYKGVYRGGRGYKNPWIATIFCKNIKYHLGCFKTEHQAALVYDLWAADLFGEFAKFNFKRAMESKIPLS